MLTDLKKILCLSVALACCGIAEGQSQEIAQPAGVIKAKPKPETLVFSPDGKLLASAEDDSSTICLWETQTGTLKVKLMGKGQPRVGNVYPTFSPDGRTLVLLDFATNEIRLWDVATEKVDIAFKGSPAMRKPVFSPDGGLLALVGIPELKLWDVAARQLRTWNPAKPLSADGLAFEPDGKVFWVSVYSGSRLPLQSVYSESRLPLQFSLYRVNLLSGKVISEIVPAEGRPFWFTLSPDGQTLATTAHSPGPYKVWNAGTGQLIATIGSHKEDPGLVAFSPNGQTLTTTADNNKINLWKRESAELIVSLKQTFGEVPRFSPDGILLGIVVGQGLSLLDARTGEPKQLLKGAGSPFAFSRNGDLLATTGKDGTVSIWRIFQR